MYASYVSVFLSQELNSDLQWKSTTVVAMPSPGELPTSAECDEWLDLLPEKPSKTRWQKWLGRDIQAPAESTSWSEQSALRNARALSNRLHLAGWLDADVQASWIPTRGGVSLELAMQCGERWKLGTISADVTASGLSKEKVLRYAALQSGMPFSQHTLQEARDRIAKGLQQDGYATFNSGHVTFQVDTMQSSPQVGLNLSVICAPQNNNLSNNSSSRDSLSGATHPRVHLGSVTWNGLDPNEAQEAGGIKSEVWSHVGTPQKGDVYNPTLIKEMYFRLSRLRSVEEVQVSNSLRVDTAENSTKFPALSAVMDVDFNVIQKPSHDIGVELDLVRNDARYGPKLSTALQHRNPRGWGAENVWQVAFGYVAVAPFSSLNTANFLNSGEWTLNWSRTQIGIVPLSLALFRPSNEPLTTVDVGWDREVWPEFTRSQFHVQHDYSFVENASRNAKWRWSPLEVSYVNLTNRNEKFEQWLLNQDNPLVQARFNNHLTLGSALGWESDWSLGRWRGRINLQGSWAGGLVQRIAESWANPESFDEISGAWLVAPGVPLIQYQRILTRFSGQRLSPRRSKFTSAAHLLLGFANSGKNTPSLPLEQAFFSGGANGIRGWRLRTLGPGNTAFTNESEGIAGVGDIRIDVQLEERYAVSDLLEIAFFSDVGNVWLHSSEKLEEAAWSWNLGGFGWSTGLGFRFDLGFFLLRLDGGLRLHDPGAEEASRWIGQGPPQGALHLGLGLPF